MINATIAKFGYPETLVAEYEHWVVLLRPQAVTLGSLVLAAKSEATAFGDLPSGAFREQGVVIASIEASLRAFVNYEKINYIMLMMVDAHVHFHVVPRYAGERSFAGTAWRDTGWPGMPDLGGASLLETSTAADMIEALRQCGLEPVGDRRG